MLSVYLAYSILSYASPVIYDNIGICQVHVVITIGPDHDTLESYTKLMEIDHSTDIVNIESTSRCKLYQCN